MSGTFRKTSFRLLGSNFESRHIIRLSLNFQLFYLALMGSSKLAQISINVCSLHGLIAYVQVCAVASTPGTVLDFSWNLLGQLVSLLFFSTRLFHQFSP